MATLSQYTFVPRPINNSMVGASQVSPTGSDGYIYFEVVQSVQQAPLPAAVTSVQSNLNSYQSGGGAGRRVGFIAYDFVNARWSFINTTDLLLVNNGWINDSGAIKDFCTNQAAPQTVDEAGNTFKVPPSIACITAG